MKDNFSLYADLYARFRPGYPDALIDCLLAHCNRRAVAWDCATGNGQLAVMLAPHFKEVLATDMSAMQLAKATLAHNIRYQQEAAEQSSAPDHYFDLITVAQAIHWFQFDDFYKEVYRTLRNDGIFAVVGYGLLHINPAIDDVIHHFYENIVGTYWDAERQYIDEAYRTIPFPFQELPVPHLFMQYSWSIDQLIGYLYTWSAVKHFIKKEQTDPLSLIIEKLKVAWGAGFLRTVTFPTLLRIGRKIP